MLPEVEGALLLSRSQFLASFFLLYLYSAKWLQDSGVSIRLGFTMAPFYAFYGVVRGCSSRRSPRPQANMVSRKSKASGMLTVLPQHRPLRAGRHFANTYHMRWVTTALLSSFHRRSAYQRETESYPETSQ